MSFKSFQVGEVLTSSDVNFFLMRQTVMVFNDEAARTAALGQIQTEGMVTYLKSDGFLSRYDGDAWVEVDGFKTAGTAGNLLVSDGTAGLVYLPNAGEGQVLTATGTGVEFREPASPFLLMGA